MSPATKLAAFALVLTVALGAGAALGSTVGPIDVGGETHSRDHRDDLVTTTTHDGHGAP